MADNNTTPSAKNNFDIFKEELSVVFGSFMASDDAWLREIWTAGKKKMEDGLSARAVPDTIIDDPKLVNFRSRFDGLIRLKERAKTEKVTYIPTIAQYVAAERENTAILKRYDLNAMANKKVLDDMFAGDVSNTELELRIVNAYNAIKNADSALREQLKSEFPTLNDADFVEGLLSGQDGSTVLQQKVLRAGISAEAATAGVTQSIGSEELRRGGVTREGARKGYIRVAEEIKGIESAAKRFGDVEVGKLQTELEKENLLGVQSKRVKSLRSQARAEFEKQSGIATGSLSRKKTGLL